MEFRKIGVLGLLLPRIIFVVFVIDIAARFAPLEWLTFRAWEAMVRYRAPCGPFRSNGYYNNGQTYGDLAAMGNLPRYRQYRREIFTTDAYGYRRNGSESGENLPPRAILVGDSMAVGSGVSDHQTLAAQLEQRTGSGVYNGAIPGDVSPSLEQILEIAARLKIDQGTILFEHIGRDRLPSRADVLRNTLATCRQWPNRLAIWYNGFVETSPLQILTQQTLRHLQDDASSPNSFSANVKIKKLADGDPMLFYPPDVKNFERQRFPDVSGVRTLAEELAKHRLRLVMVLIPDKYTVYEPLVKNPGNKKTPNPLYLDRVEAALKNANVPVVNLTPFMRQQAKVHYQEKQYLYWHDDTHWNARGIELAAEEIIRQNLIR